MTNTWLLEWNPVRWCWDREDDFFTYEELAQDIEQIGFAIGKWSCAMTTDIQEGDRIFLMRVGTQPKGIMAAGIAMSSVFMGKNWDENKRALGKPVRRIYIRFESVSCDFQRHILPLETLHLIAPEYDWTPYGSGYRIPPEVASKLEEAWLKARQK